MYCLMFTVDGLQKTDVCDGTNLKRFIGELAQDEGATDFHIYPLGDEIKLA